MRTRPDRLLAALVAWSLLWLAASARADTLTIKSPGDHPRYLFEAEPHLLLGFIDPPGLAHGTGIGLGGRGTLILVKNGFVPQINNSVGIGFGLDWVHYGRGAVHCDKFSAGAAGGCFQETDAQSLNTVFVPVVMQWNFWLTRQWSVFGEPGLGLHYGTDKHGLRKWGVDPELYVGGRFHLADTVALTLRAGYPTFSVGASFLL